MKTDNFIKGIQETLELEDKEIKINSPLNITSLGTLSLIVYIDENFNKRCNVKDLREVNTISDLMNLIGQEHFE